MKKRNTLTTTLAASVISALGFGGCRTAKNASDNSIEQGLPPKLDREQIIDDMRTVKPLYGVQIPRRERMIDLPEVKKEIPEVKIDPVEKSE